MLIKIHFYLFLFMAYLFWQKKLPIYILFYLSALIHEFAHIIMSLLLNNDVPEVYLLPFGINARYSNNVNIKRENLISVAGPIISIIMAIFLKNNMLKRINLTIAFFNLIPIYPLDGGRLLKNHFLKKYSNEIALKKTRLVSDLFIIIILSMAIFTAIYLNNPYLLFLCLYLYSVSRTELKKERILRLINYLQTDE